MSVEEFNKLTLAVVAVVATVVGPLLQWLIARRQARLQDDIAKRQVAESVAGKRKEWSDSLRADLAIMLTQYTQMTEVMKHGASIKSTEERTALYVSRGNAAAMLAYESLTRIRLRLQPEKESHRQLLASLSRMRAFFKRVMDGEDLSDPTWEKIREEILTQARAILHEEWEIVIRGSAAS